MRLRTELVHELGDDTVEMESVVEAFVRQVHNVAHCNWHVVEKELSLHRAHGRLHHEDRVVRIALMPRLVISLRDSECAQHQQHAAPPDRHHGLPQH